jgi:hypothetical protein
VDHLPDGKWTIRITTPEVAEREQITVVYAVKDLVVNGPVADFGSLIDNLQSSVTPSSWDDVGGPGSVSEDDQTISLIVSQTWTTQLLVDDFLTNLREQRLVEGVVEVPETPELIERRKARQRFIALAAKYQPYKDRIAESLYLLDISHRSAASEQDLQLLKWFPTLRDLRIRGCGVTGAFLDKLSGEVQLTRLDASSTRFDDDRSTIVSIPSDVPKPE